MYLLYNIKGDDDVKIVYDKVIDDFRIKPGYDKVGKSQIDEFGYVMYFHDTDIDDIRYDRKIMIDMNFIHVNPHIVNLIREYKLNILCF